MKNSRIPILPAAGGLLGHVSRRMRGRCAALLFFLLALPAEVLAQSDGQGFTRARNFSLMDALLIGIVIMILVRMVSRRRRPPGQSRPWDQSGPQQRPGQRPPQRPSHPGDPERLDPDNPDAHSQGPVPRRQLDRYTAAEAAWRHLQGQGQSGQPDQGRPGQPAPGPREAGAFEEQEFLRGAKAVYARLHDSLADGDMDDIRQFAEEPVLDQIAGRAHGDGGDSQPPEIMLVDARLAERNISGGREYATVAYTVLLREDPTASQPKEVREMWKFARDPQDPASTWKLAEILPSGSARLQ